jgi:CubicO group peptidase (beta-lactamase class C family)
MYSTTHYPDVESGLTIFQNDSLLFEPGTRYAYSSYGWNLISAALESASGMPFLDMMLMQVFEKAGMDRTVPEFAPPILPHRAHFYDVADDGSITNAPYVDNSYKWAGGGFLSTAGDLVRFGDAMLRGNLVQRATFEWLITSQQTRDGTSTHYGIGWRTDMTAVAIRGLRQYDAGLAQEAETMLAGVTVVGHTGGAIGGSALFLVAPEHGVVVAALSNSTLRPSFAIHLLAQIIDAMP